MAAGENLDLVIRGFDDSGPAFESAKRNLATVKKQNESMAPILGKIGGLMAGVFTVGSIVTFVKSGIDSIDMLNDLKDATGASIGNLSALQDVTLRTGHSMDDMTALLVKLNATLNAATPGSQQALNLQAIGLSVDELKKKDPAQALLDVAHAMGNFADDGNKARLAQELFGKSLKEVAPLLNDLADVQQLNATVTDEQAAAADRFNKNLAELKKGLLDVSRTVAGPVMAEFNAFIEALKYTDGLFDAIVTYGTINPFRSQAGNIAAYREELEKLSSDKETYLKRGWNTSAIDADITDVTKKLQYLLALQRAAALGNGGSENQSSAESARLARQNNGGIDPQASKGKPSVKIINKKAVDEAQAQGERYAQIMATIREANAQRGEQYNAKLAVMNMGSQAAEQLQSQMAVQNEYLKYKDQLTKATPADMLGGDLYKNELAEIEKAQAEALRQVDAYYAALKEKQADWTVGAESAWAEWAENAANVAAQTKQLFTQALDGVSGKLADVVIDGKAELSDLVRSLARMYAEMEIKQGMLGLAQLTGFSTTGAAATHHAGGIAGDEPTSMRKVDMSVFNGAPRYHAGGLAGDEVPAILQRGEPVFTKGQAKALGLMANAGMQAASAAPTQVIIHNYSGEKVKQREVTDGRGSRSVVVQIGEASASELTRSGSGASKAFRGAYGIEPMLVGR